MPRLPPVRRTLLALLGRKLFAAANRRPPRRPTLRLGLECLEDRITPSVTVTTTTDPATPVVGELSLREAVNMVNAGQVADNTIILPAGTYQNAQGALNVTHSLIVRGAGPDTTILNGGGTDRVVLIDPAAAVNVQLDGVAIRNGRTGGFGGGINVQDVLGQASVLTLNNCVVSGNEAGQGGGGINNFNGDVILNDCEALNNKADAGEGGGVSLEKGGTDNLTVSNSTVSGNSAGDGGGGLALLDNGGAGKLTITVSTISNNTVTTNTVDGGGGIVVNSTGAVLVSGTTFRGNSAPLDGGAFVSTFDVSGSITFSDDTFTGNSTTQGNGGAISVHNASPVTLRGCTLTGNTAAGNGGGFSDTGNGTVDVEDSTFTGNTAGTSGGGIEDQTPTLTAANSAFENNQADNGNGGGIDVADGTNQTVLLTNVTFRGNSVVGGNFSAGTGFGGGLGVSSASTLNLVGCLFANNTAVVEGGGLEQIQGTLSIFASQVTGNVAKAGGGGGLGFAGSVYTISGSTFDNNKASGVGGGAFIVANPTGASASSLLVNDTFAGNMASQGGGLDVGGGQPVTLLNDTITGNAGPQAVGGIFISSPVVLQNTIVAGNTSNAQPDITFLNSFTDNGGNLIGNRSGFFGALSPTDQVGANPLLGPLADNGGPLAGAIGDQQVVQTEALLPGSPAIGTGIANGAPNNDERGFPRPAAPDVGAFEFQNVPLALTVTPMTPTVRVNGTDTFTVTVRNTGNTPLPADNSMLAVTPSDGLTATGPLTFTLSALPAGQVQTFTVTARAVALGPQTLSVALTSPDANSASVTTSATVSVLSPTNTNTTTPTPHAPVGALTVFAFGVGPTGIDLFEVDSAGDVFAQPFMGGAPLFLDTALHLPLAVLADGQLLAFLTGGDGRDYLIDVFDPFSPLVEPAVLAALTG